MYMLCIKIKRQMQNQYLLVSLFPPLTFYLSLSVGIFDFFFLGLLLCLVDVKGRVCGH